MSEPLTSPSGAAFAASEAIVIEGASKAFGPTQALAGVDLTFRRGEIHALLGQNGAGKSTLFKILAGVYEPDAGMRLQVGDEVVEGSLSPRESQALGFKFVHQDLALVDSMSIMENVCVQGFTTAGGRIRWREQARTVEELLREFGLDISARTALGDLPQVDKATVAIARAFYSRDGNRPSLLVLDEPTAHLPVAERDHLFAAMRRAADLGAAVVFSTHRLDEVLALSERISILRDGRLVWSGPSTEVDGEEALITRILGQDLDRFYPDRQDTTATDQRLEVRQLTGSTVDALDLVVRKGEIVGLTGLVGAGHDAVPYLLMGATDAESGEVVLDGKVLSRLTPQTATRAGMGLLPADRTRDSGILALTVRENLTMTTLGDFTHWGRIRRREERARTNELLDEFDVRPAGSSEIAMAGLSGGNQQKVLLARSLMRNELRCLILHEPTQGVDVGAKQSLLRQIAAVAQRGVSVLLVSTDNEDLSNLCDRVMVMRHGRVRAELHHPHPDRIAEQCLASQ